MWVGFSRTMMRKVETSINPYAILGDRDVFLWINGPIAWSRNTVFACCHHFDSGRKQRDEARGAWRTLHIENMKKVEVWWKSGDSRVEELLSNLCLPISHLVILFACSSSRLRLSAGGLNGADLA